MILNKLSGAAQLRVHHGRHGERHHLLRAGQEQEGGEEGRRHLCSGGNVQRALWSSGLVFEMFLFLNFTFPADPENLVDLFITGVCSWAFE